MSAEVNLGEKHTLLTKEWAFLSFIAMVTTACCILWLPSMHSGYTSDMDVPCLQGGCTGCDNHHFHKVNQSGTVMLGEDLLPLLHS